MSAEKTLADINESLKPEPKQATPSQQIPFVAFDFSEIVAQLKELKAERQRQNDLIETFTQIDFDIKTLADKADSNLKKTEQILNRLDSRLKAVDSLEAKWSLLIERVAGVLDQLEVYLRKRM